MSIEQIVILFVLVTGVGIFLAGIMIKVITNKRNKSCSKTVIGKVVKHQFQGEGRMCPVVEFEIDGNTYLTNKKFNSVKTIRTKGFPISIKADAYEDDKGNLFVKTGPIANMEKLAEELWPIGKEMAVSYNPQNPKINYVVRPITNNFLTVFSEIMGIIIILSSIAIFLLVSKGQ